MKKQRRMNVMIFQRLSLFLSLFFILVGSSIYIFISTTIEESTINKNIEISKQINQNFITYFDNLINSSQNISNLINDEEIKGIQSIEEILNFSVVIYDDVDELSLYDSEYNLVAQTKEFQIKKEWYEQAFNDQTTYHFHSEYITETNSYNGFITRKIDYFDGVNYKQGVIFIKMDFEKLISITQNTNLGENGHICVIDSSYDVILSTNIDIDTTIYLKELILGNDTIKYEKTNIQIYLNTISNSPWRIAVFSNIDSIYETNIQLFVTLVIMTISCIALSLYIIYRITSKVTNPLNKLELIMKEIEESRMFLHIENVDSSIAEISSLTNRFNKMIDEVRLLLDKVILEQKSQRLSELKSLQNQINPHFLYNTLDSIVWLAENNENEKVIEMTISLSKLFRISISRGKFIIPVKDEIHHARCYLTIQKIRYQEAFNFEFEVDDDVLEYDTMKLTLQPLIENAIYHGLRNRVDIGVIKIKAYKEFDNVIYEVIDNGYGIREEKIQNLYDTFNNPNLNDGVGMKNVYQRLMIYFNEKAKLEIISELDEGTTIKITIPINKEINCEKDNNNDNSINN